MRLLREPARSGARLAQRVCWINGVEGKSGLRARIRVAGPGEQGVNIGPELLPGGTLVGRQLGERVGVAHPGQVVEVLDVVTARVPLGQVALHLHDTRGTALANVLAGLQYGVTTFDSAAGGLGGCPYAPGASGNLATEDLLYMLDGLGIETGVSLPAVVAASRALAASITHPLPSKYLQAAGTGTRKQEPETRN